MFFRIPTRAEVEAVAAAWLLNRQNIMITARELYPNYGRAKQQAIALEAMSLVREKLDVL